MRYRLPTRPPKKGDTRNDAFSEAFGSAECVELDALPPDTLTNWVRRDIERHINQESWQRVRRAEEAQRNSLESTVARFYELDEVEDEGENLEEVGR